MDEVKVSELLDRAEIADLVARYCRAIDEYDIEAACSVFTDDVVTDYGPGRGGVVEGRAAAVARLGRGQSEFRKTHHQLGQQLLDLDGDEAGAVSYAIAWHERWDGSRDTLYLRYVDRLVRRDGRWLIAKRELRVSGVEGFPGTEWAWVERGLPAGRS